MGSRCDLLGTLIALTCGLIKCTGDEGELRKKLTSMLGYAVAKKGLFRYALRARSTFLFRLHYVGRIEKSERCHFHLGHKLWNVRLLFPPPPSFFGEGEGAEQDYIGGTTTTIAHT